MDNEKNLRILSINPFALAQMDNPTDEMKLTALRKNGMVLQFIKNPTPEMIDIALSNAPRAIQYIENPSHEILEQVVSKGWNNLGLIENPDESLVRLALAESGWAIQYVKAPSEELQILAVKSNYDAIKFIENPSKAVQLAAVGQNYQALSYIKEPVPEAIDFAVTLDPQAVRLLGTVTVDQALHFIGISSLITKYLPPDYMIPPIYLEERSKEILADENTSEQYVRDLLNCTYIGKHNKGFEADVVGLIDQFGTQKARRIAVDELLKF